jgi:hypothetical protein
MEKGSIFEKPDTRDESGVPAMLLQSQKTMGSLMPHTVSSNADPKGSPEIVEHTSNHNKGSLIDFNGAIREILSNGLHLA